jgi:hypothetical protein
MAGFNDPYVVELLDLSENDELPVHSITFSKSTIPAAPSEETVAE